MNLCKYVHVAPYSISQSSMQHADVSQTFEREKRKQKRAKPGDHYGTN